MVDRIDFFARVKKALDRDGASTPAPVHPPLQDNLMRQVAVDDPDRVERYVSLARKTGFVIERVRPDALLPALDKCLANHPIKSALVNAAAYDVRFALSPHLASKSIITKSWGDPDCWSYVFNCDAAITNVRYGLADTGGVLVWSDPTFGRSSTLTPQVHIIILPESKILADLVDAFNRIRQDNAGQMPSNVVVINGPSKTSDIESNLVTGVHGPKYVYVLLLEGE